MSQLPKRLTPLQEVFEKIHAMYMANHADGDYGNGKDRAYQDVIALIEDVLPSEQQLLSETFDAGEISKVYYVDYDIREYPFVNSKDVVNGTKTKYLSQFNQDK